MTVACPSNFAGKPVAPPFTVSVCGTTDQIAECQRLRYRVFVEELGAQIDPAERGHEVDAFDRHCTHLLVRERESGRAVATTRLLLDTQAQRIGMFYSETEFDLRKILGLKGRRMEVGRTCILPEFRRSLALSVLWQGIARLVEIHAVDYLFGCVSLPLANGEAYVAAVMERMREHYMIAPELRVTPRYPLRPERVVRADGVRLPTLLKGYLSQGALVGGEPCRDAAFDVADIFVLLDRDRLSPKYARRFLRAA